MWETMELERLMTLEMAVSDIESGRGKTRMRVSWEYLCKLYDRKLQDKEFEKIIFLDIGEYYVQAYRDLFSKHVYIPAPDVKAGLEETAFIYNETLNPISVIEKPEGSYRRLSGRRRTRVMGVPMWLSWPLRGCCIKDVADISVAIQGFGNVVSYVAKCLYESDTKTTRD